MGIGLRLALAAAVLGACSSDPDPIEDFTIVFQLDTDGEAATCRPGVGLPPPLTCNSFNMGCNARVAIRLLSIPEDEDDPIRFLDDPYCLLLEWDEGIDDICALGDPQFLQFVQFNSVSRVRGQVEVTIWRDSPAVESCPLIPYDVAGRPIPQSNDLNPAFGRRVIFDFGGLDPVAEVPLACNAPQTLSDATCAPPITYDLEVHADDLDNLLLGIEEEAAQSLQVLVGQPRPLDPTDPDPDDFEIVSPAHTIELGLTGGGAPFWKEDDHVIAPEVDFVVEEGREVCAIVTDFGSQPAATCTTITAEQEARSQPVRVDGFMVSTDTWDKIQSAIGLNLFPSDGLVLGRVVDTNMNPLTGVVVTPDTLPLPVIWYLNEDLTDTRDAGMVPLTATTSSGYFVARGSKFRTTWNATRTDWHVVGTPMGGELNNKTLTVLLITMAMDFGS